MTHTMCQVTAYFMYKETQVGTDDREDLVS